MLNLHIEEYYGIFEKGLLFLANQNQDHMPNMCTMRA